MMLDLRYCKKCKKAYDIATNYEICSDCRIEEEFLKTLEVKR